MESQFHSEYPGALVGDMGKLLTKHGTLYSAGFTWSPEPNCKRSFRSEYYATAEECDRVTVRALRDLGYQKPRWFEYWRWGEPRPNERVMAALDRKNPID